MYVYKISLFFLKLSSLKIIYIIVKCHHSHYPAISWRIWISFLSLYFIAVSFSSRADGSRVPCSFAYFPFSCSLLVLFHIIFHVQTFLFHLSHSECPRGNNIQNLHYFNRSLAAVGL